MLGFSCCLFFIPFSQGWTLLGGSGGGWDARSFRSSATLVSLVAGWMSTIHLSAKINRSDFLPAGAEQGDTGTAAVAQGLVLLHGSALPRGGRIHPPPLASAAGDGHRGTKVPVHGSWERADLKVVVGDCLNISPFFFICLRGFAVLVTPLRDLSSSLFGYEYLTSF